MSAKRVGMIARSSTGIHKGSRTIHESLMNVMGGGGLPNNPVDASSSMILPQRGDQGMGAV